jgi:predicted TIM-barrel enzyme
VSKHIQTEFIKTFGQPKVLLPVIHVDNGDQAKQQCDIATSAGCKGVFLINHRIKSTKLISIANDIISQFPNLWVGANLLDLTAQQAFERLPQSARGLWVDDAYIHEGDPLDNAAAMVRRIRERDGLLYFASVAFKYQKPVTNVRQIALLASGLVDVVVTSGEGTGEAAYIGKVVAMKEGMLPHRHLGLASGVTENNVADYLPYVDAFLVATGISKSFTELDLEKTKKLNDIINSYQP